MRLALAVALLGTTACAARGPANPGAPSTAPDPRLVRASDARATVAQVNRWNTAGDIGALVAAMHDSVLVMLPDGRAVVGREAAWAALDAATIDAEKVRVSGGEFIECVDGVLQYGALATYRVGDEWTDYRQPIAIRWVGDRARPQVIALTIGMEGAARPDERTCPRRAAHVLAYRRALVSVNVAAPGTSYGSDYYGVVSGIAHALERDGWTGPGAHAKKPEYALARRQRPFTLTVRQQRPGGGGLDLRVTTALAMTDRYGGQGSDTTNVALAYRTTTIELQHVVHARSGVASLGLAMVQERTQLREERFEAGGRTPAARQALVADTAFSATYPAAAGRLAVFLPLTDRIFAEVYGTGWIAAPLELPAIARLEGRRVNRSSAAVGIAIGVGL